MRLTPSKKLKFQLEFYKKQDGKCYWCDLKLLPPDYKPRIKGNTTIYELEGEPSVIDRLIPGSKGGYYNQENCVLSCVKCNNRKANKIWIKKDGKIIELKTQEAPFQRRQRNVAHLWADKKALRYFRKNFKKVDYRNLRTIYLSLCEIESDFIEELRDGKEGIQGFHRTLQTYSGLGKDTVGKYLKILKDLGALSVKQIKTKEGEFSTRSTVILYSFPFSDSIRKRMKQDVPFTHSIRERTESHHKNTNVGIIDKNSFSKEKEDSGELPSSQKKKDKAPKKKGSPVHRIFKGFIECCEGLKGFTPVVNYGVDGAMVKKRLKQFEEKELLNCVDWYLNSDLSGKWGISLKTALCAQAMNKWQNQRGPM